jgi:hypothetical protein
MALTISPFQAEHEAAVAAFNERARLNNAPFLLNKTPVAGWLPKRDDGRTLYREFFLALDAGEVRGGFTLRRQNFWLNGEILPMANYQGPLSEGLWERRYMMAGVQMLRAALRDQPLLYALGMGGRGQPLPKLLASAGWAIAEVPFRFKVLRAAKFLRNIRPVRRTAARAAALDIAALTGAGPLAVHALQWWHTSHKLSADAKCDRAPDFGAWADEVWSAARGKYSFTAIRDRDSQNILFGDGNEKNIILHCTRDGRDIGWAVVRSTPMRDDKYFGNLRLGSIVDCLAVPGDEATVVALAARHLARLGSDVVVTNQSHARWLAALGANGWFSGPSNFLFAASPQLAERLGPLEKSLATIHFNRADGDGPIHL